MLQDLLTFGARRRLATLAIIVVATLIAAFGVVHLRIDTSYDKLISENDPGWSDYSRIVREFGSDNTTIILFRDRNLFAPDRLKALDRLIGELESDPKIERVDSLYSAPNIRDVEGDLETGSIVDAPPDTADEAAAGRFKALYSPLVRRNLLNGDGTVTAVNVSLKRHAADRDFNKAIYESIEARIATVRPNFEQVFQIGPPRLNIEIERGMYHDLATLMPLSTLILVATVFYFLRTWTASIVPLVTAGISIFWTLGFMGWTNIPLTLLTTLVPALNIVIGSAEDTHMMSTYLRSIAAQEKPSRQVAIRFMASHIGIAILLTSSTTVIGFLSDALYDIPIMIEFAFAASFALTANFFATILLMPLLLATIGPLRSKLPPQTDLPDGILGKVVNWLEYVGREHRKLVLAVAGAIAAVSVYFALDLKVSNDPLSYFRPSSPLVKDAAQLHRDLAGMQVFYLTLESRNADFASPRMLKKAEAIEKVLKNRDVFDNVTSLPDMVALVHREMNRGDPAYWHVPDDGALIEQYLLLFKRSDVDRYVSSDMRQLNIVVRHNLSDSSVFNGIVSDIGRSVRAIAGDDMEVRFAGKNLMVNRSAEGLIENQADSLIWVVLVILVLMALLYQSVLAGLVSMIPNVIPIAICFGTMGLLGVPLNPGTASVAAVALGIAVDDTIHFFSTYLQACRHEPDPERAIRDTVRGESIPVVATTIALSAGFLILIFSDFTIVAQYGWLSAYTIVVALFVDLFLTPALLRGVRLVGLWDVLALRLGAGDILLASPLFAGMTRREIKKAILLSKLAEHPAGADIVAAGAEESAMYVVLTGRAEVRSERAVISTLQPGDVFGEVGFVGATRRTATVVATEAVQLLAIDSRTMRQATLMHPFIMNKLLLNISRILGRRLAEAT